MKSGDDKIYIFQLAAKFRETGAHKRDRKDLERDLKRPLTMIERRALAIAADPRSRKPKKEKPYAKMRLSKTEPRTVEGGAPGMGKRNAGNTFTVKHGPNKL